MQFPPPDPAHGPVRDAAVDELTPDPTTPPPEAGRRARPGDLTTSWRVMLGLGWLAAFFAYAGVWQASVQIGIGTWWVGPRAQPTPILVRLVPFYLALVVGLLIVYNVKWVVRWSALGVLGMALIAIPDFSRSIGLGVAEAAIAGMLAVITLASLTGRYRAPASPSDDDGAVLDPAPR